MPRLLGRSFFGRRSRLGRDIGGSRASMCLMAAEELGITPRQIGYRIKKYGLSPQSDHELPRLN